MDQTYTVALSPAAGADMEQIVEWAAQNDWQNASQLVAQLKNRYTRSLAHTPRMGRDLKLDTAFAPRRLVVGEYNVLYFIDEDAKRVVVLRVLHRLQSTPAIGFDESAPQ